MIAGVLSSSVSSPPSTSRVTFKAPLPSSIFEANVPCDQPSSAASIWPVWLESSSIDCLPMMMRSGFSFSTSALSVLATASGSTPPRSMAASVFTRMPRSAPIAMAVRTCSSAFAGPMETTMTSVALPASFRRTASSMAISSNGLTDILTLASSTPVLSAFTRILTL